MRDTNDTLREQLATLLPSWRVMGEGGEYDLENWSPAGEDVIISIRGEDIDALRADALDAWDAFDPEEHAAEILCAKRSGDPERERFYADAPDSLEELLEDAEAIDAMYREVADALA